MSVTGPPVSPAEPPSGRTTTGLIEGVALLALAAAAIRDRLASGLQIELFAIAFAVAGHHLDRLHALARRRPWRRWWLLALELGALAGLLWHPEAVWGVGFGLAGGLALCMSLAVERAEEPDAPAGVHVATLGLVLGVAAWTVAEVALERPLATIRVLVAAALIVEALLPGSGRSERDALRRATLALALLALGAHRGDLPEEAALGSVPIGAVGLALVAAAPGPPERRRARRARALARVLLVACALALLLAVGEVAVRLAPSGYKELLPSTSSHFHEPNALFRYEGVPLHPRVPPELVVEFRWNARGWHDVEHAQAKPPGTTRVLVVGDSYVEATMIPTEGMLHRRLERELAGVAPVGSAVAVEAIAMGWSGWGQVHELAALRSEGLGYAPDIVIVEFLPGNDVRNNDPELEDLANRDFWGTTPMRRLHARAVDKRLLSVAALCDKLDLALRNLMGKREPLDGDVYRAQVGEHAEVWARAWRRTEESLAELKRACDEASAELVVVGFTSPSEIAARVPGQGGLSPEGYDYALPARRVGEVCARLGVPFLDLAERFAALPPEDRARIHYDPWDGHWSPFGHERAADETARFLVSSGVWSRALERR